jgi:hypothetical protein
MRLVFKFLNCSNDLRTQKMSFSEFMLTAFGFILLAAYFSKVAAVTLLF